MAKRVLIVEDYYDARKLMSMLIQPHGYEVIEAADGAEAVAKAIAERPDIVLMDIGLPEIDGLEAARSIRRHEVISQMPIVAVTAFGDRYKDEALAAGCDFVIQKPVNYDELVRVMRQLLS